jgi:hypothetical protein
MRVDVLAAFAYLLGPLSGKSSLYRQCEDSVRLRYSFPSARSGNSERLRSFSRSVLILLPFRSLTCSCSIPVGITYHPLARHTDVGIFATISSLVQNVPHDLHYPARCIHGVSLSHTCIADLHPHLPHCRFRAFIDASRNGLARFQLPVIGQWADAWVFEE